MKSVRFAAVGSLWRALRAGSRPGTPGVGDRLRSLPRLVTATFLGRYRGTSRLRLLAMAVGIVYVLSPVDLVPELFVPFLGLVDDAFVLAWLTGAVLVETERFLVWEADQHTVVTGQVLR
jgi:uncharacterized membrane protein YkvA (DUF1232 family)